MADTIPDLSRPLVLDRTAFKSAADQGEPRTDIFVAFGDGEYRFHLDDAQVRHVEARRLVSYATFPGLPGRSGAFALADGGPCGLGAVYARLCRGRALLATGEPLWAGIGTSDLGHSTFARSDIELVIGRGLVGGGEGVVDAKPIGIDTDAAAVLVERYVIGAPLEPLWTLAFAIVGVRLFGREPDPVTGR